MNDDDSQTVCVIVARGGEHAGAPVRGYDQKRGFLLFVLSSDYDEAISVALKMMSELGWERIEPQQVGFLEKAPEDETLVPPYEDALEGGFAAVIFEPQGE